jgi:hypothetical protein
LWTDELAIVNLFRATIAALSDRHLFVAYVTLRRWEVNIAVGLLM